MGQTVVLGLLGVFAATLLFQWSQIFFILPLIPVGIYYLIVQHEKKSISNLTSMGFAPSSSFDFLYGRSIHIDEKSRKIACIERGSLLVANFDESLIIRVFAKTLDGKKETLTVSFEVSFREKSTNYLKKMSFHDVPVDVYRKLESVWPK